LGETFRGLAILGVQDPVHLDDFSEPEPDLAVLRHKDDFYLDHHPRPEDVFLVVEVADSTLEFDRRRKLPLYARSGIPEVWIVNLVDGLLEVYRDPAPHGYRQSLRLSREDTIVPTAFPDVELFVGDLLG
jgi:Uma2 family endonuclease